MALAFGAAANAGETVTYGYDALGRVVSVTRSGGPSAAFPITTSYDPAGNRTNYTVANAPPASPGPVSFSIVNASAVDEGAPAIFKVVKTGSPSGTLTVNYATSSGTATSGSDFTATSGTLSFLFWETEKTVAVPTIRDGVAEPAETLGMALSAPSGGATIATGSATGTINVSSAANQPPVANGDSGSVRICETVYVNVIANDTDPEGNYPLTLVGVGTSTKGDASVWDSNTVAFSAYGTTGGTQITYTVRDSLGATATGVLGIQVNTGPGCQ